MLSTSLADPLRFDRWEGIDVVLQPGRSHIKIDGRRFELSAPGLMYLGGPPPSHVWCAYAVTAGRVRQNLAMLGRAVEDRHVHWGSHAVVIHDVPEFLRRARQSFRSLSVGCSQGLVIYVPEDHEGELGPFRKRDTYSYQGEFRFVVRGWPDDVLYAEIGSLQDLAVLATAEDAVSLEVHFEDE